jgi:hypothetical protein
LCAAGAAHDGPDALDFAAVFTRNEALGVLARSSAASPPLTQNVAWSTPVATYTPTASKGRHGAWHTTATELPTKRIPRASASCA